MGKSYNALNDVKIDWQKTGICPECSLRLTDPKCSHATPEQIEFVRILDGEFTDPAETWGPDWERDADNLHFVLENGEAQIELEETLQWLGVEVKTPELQVVKSTRHATAEWAKRHLNVEINGFEAELNTAFGKGNWTLK